MRHIVNGLLLSEGKVLLARRSKARAAYPDLWSFPGGHVESQETLSAALIRELSEEIGIVPGESRLVAEFEDPNIGSDPATYHLFVIGKWVGTPTIRDQEHSELQWFGLGDAAQLHDLALNEYRGVFLALLQSESRGIGNP